jgi:hypothetical protein
MVIILVFTIINLKLSESRIFMTPNVWLTTKEGPKMKIENLKPVSPQDNVNKNVANNVGYRVRLKNNPVEELGSSPFPKGKKRLFIYRAQTHNHLPHLKPSISSHSKPCTRSRMGTVAINDLLCMKNARAQIAMDFS